jgi:hypothetical protein
MCGGLPGWLHAYASPFTTGTQIPAACTDALLAACGALDFPAPWLTESATLVALRDAAASGAHALEGWSAYRPPCTSRADTGTCYLCGWQDTCGAVRTSDSKLLCNWRHVECKDRRVTTILVNENVSGPASAD